jgi:hypothetical protein
MSDFVLKMTKLIQLFCLNRPFLSTDILQVSLVVCLVELLLLLSACCFADHIRKLQRGDSEKANSEKEGIIDSNEEAYSIHHEESKSSLIHRLKLHNWRCVVGGA